MDVTLTRAELRSLVSFEALRKPTFAECDLVLTFSHTDGAASASIRDRYRAVRLHLEATEPFDSFSVPLAVVRDLARDDGNAAERSTLSHDPLAGTLSFGGAVHRLSGGTVPVARPVAELFSGNPANVNGVAYAVNVELSAAVQRLSTPADFLTKTPSHLWSVSLLHAGTHTRLLHRRGPVEFVLQTAGNRLP